VRRSRILKLWKNIFAVKTGPPTSPAISATASLSATDKHDGSMNNCITATSRSWNGLCPASQSRKIIVLAVSQLLPFLRLLARGCSEEQMLGLCRLSPYAEQRGASLPWILCSARAMISLPAGHCSIKQ
jgi:hypothetical protein